MKKITLFASVVAFAAVFASCSSNKDCITCNGGGVSGEICKDQYEAGAGSVPNAPSWETYSTNLINSGYCE